MINKPRLTEHHYTATNLISLIKRGLEASGKNLNNLTIKDLAPIDVFHVRGIKATKELTALIKINRNDIILDIGCGLGGSARYLASNFECHVTGIDITKEYCNTATELSKLIKLNEKTEFHQADATEIPFKKEMFNIVWSEHVQMNIENKRKLYQEIYRVLKPNGKLIFYDVFKGNGNNIFYPVPWANDSSIDFLAEQNEIKTLIESIEFKINYWEDKTDLSKNWFSATVTKMKNREPSPLGLHLVMGENSEVKFHNMVRNLNEGNITVAQAVVEKKC